MNRSFFRQAFRTLGGSALAILLWGMDLHAPADGGLFARPVQAEESEPPKNTRRVPSMSESSFKKLSEAQELLDAKPPQLDQAIRVLNDGIEARRNALNGNEKGQFYNMLGYVYFMKEDYGRAIDNYKLVIAQGEDIPEGLEVTTLYTLAQLSFVSERYQDALRYMETWLTKATNPGPEPQIFMCQVYYQMQNFPRAISQCEKGIRVAQERGTPPKEQWYALLNYLYYEQENWPKVLETLEVLVRTWPKRDYWVRLAGIHGQLGNDKKQMYSMEAAHVAGFLDRESDITSYAGLLMQEEVPYRAAKVLDKGLKDKIVERDAKNLRSLGQAWQLSQEVQKAIPVYEEAGKLSEDGVLLERLAHLYMENDNFNKCVTAADGALQKGGLRSRANAYIVKGMCMYNADNLGGARGAFTSCRNTARSDNDEGNLRICQQWITYIDRETARREQIEKAI